MPSSSVRSPLCRCRVPFLTLSSLFLFLDFIRSPLLMPSAFGTQVCSCSPANSCPLLETFSLPVSISTLQLQSHRRLIFGSTGTCFERTFEWTLVQLLLVLMPVCP